MPENGMDWWVIAGVVVAVIAVWIAWRQFKGRKPANKTKVTVTGSPGATVAGRDIGGTGEAGDHEAEVDVKESARANVSGRDVGKE